MNQEQDCKALFSKIKSHFLDQLNTGRWLFRMVVKGEDVDEEALESDFESDNEHDEDDQDFNYDDYDD